MSADAAAGFCLVEVAGVAVAGENHTADAVGENWRFLRCHVVEEVFRSMHFFLCRGCLINGDATESGELGAIDCAGDEIKFTDDSLNKFYVVVFERGGELLSPFVYWIFCLKDICVWIIGIRDILSLDIA